MNTAPLLLRFARILRARTSPGNRSRQAKSCGRSARIRGVIMLALAGWAPRVAPAQVPGVPFYNGVIESSTSSTGNQTDSKGVNRTWSLQQKVKLSIDLDNWSYPVVLGGKATGSAEIDFTYTETNSAGCKSVRSVKYSGSYVAPAVWYNAGRPYLTIVPPLGYYELYLPQDYSANLVMSTRCSTGTPDLETRPVRLEWGETPLTGNLSPEGVIEGQRQGVLRGFPNSVFANIPAPAYSLSYRLAAKAEDAELVVDPQGYDAWRPRAGADETSPGNRIEIRARLQGKGGGATAAKAKKFRFELVSASKEPGISMNMPGPGGARELLDMRFDEQPPLIISNEGLAAESAGPESAESSAMVTSYDWGGYATLKVTAELTDGRRLTGYLKGDAATTEILLPKRARNSLIADVWKREKGISGLPDNDDSENNPAGDSHQGDGLTLYEEYRGFHENGIHIEGNPKKKDYFILDQAKGLYKAGIALFASVTGLEVHHKFRSSEIPSSRVMNFNLGGGPHRVDQHAIIIAISPALKGAAETLGGPGLPREIRKINLPAVPPGFRGFRTVGGSPPVSYVSAALAHELLHASNVYHHGEESNDVGKVRWTAGGEEGPVLENGVPIRVLTEDGIELRPPLLPLPLNVYIGGNQGTNSGVENCLMRYDNSQAYIAKSDRALRYFIYYESQGFGLCDRPQGSGVNDKDHVPQPRYGDADVNRGRNGCKFQICVNDAMSHKPR